jgi:hypothetical protein
MFVSGCSGCCCGGCCYGFVCFLFIYFYYYFLFVFHVWVHLFCDGLGPLFLDVTEVLVVVKRFDVT